MKSLILFFAALWDVYVFFIAIIFGLILGPIMGLCALCTTLYFWAKNNVEISLSFIWLAMSHPFKTLLLMRLK